jgi:hypothetical protein
MDHLQTAYARLIEQLLLDRPGVLVVELSEAKAIAQEIALSSSAAVERRLPLYLTGEYRVEGVGEKRRAQFAWKLHRGERQLETCKAADLPVDRLPVDLRKAALEMLGKAIGQSPKPPDAAVEVQQLIARADAFEAIGNWPETVALAEAGLVLAPGDVRLHGHALKALGQLAGALHITVGPINEMMNDQPAVEQYVRAALPHAEAYLRSVQVDQEKHQWCAGRPWRGLHSQLQRPIGLPHHRSLVGLWKEVMPMAERILAAKALAKAQDHSLDLMAYMTEPPGPCRFETSFEPWPDWSFARVCDHRLRLLRQFAYLRQGRRHWNILVQIVYPYNLIITSYPQDPSKTPSSTFFGWDEPVYRKFLDDVEKLPNAEMQEIARRTRKEIDQGPPKWPPPPITQPTFTKVAFEPLTDEQAIFHPIELTVAGEPSPFRGHPWLWFKTAEGTDVVATRLLYPDKLEVHAVKKKGQLVRLPLKARDVGGDAAGGYGKNFCWDGKLFWVAVPDSGDLRGNTAPRPGTLSAVDPVTERISATFTADDGLPPADYYSMAVTGLGPGKALVAGYFGRSWCAIATWNAEKGKSLDVFFEAREIAESGQDRAKVKTAASGVAFLRTINVPAADGRPAEQKVLLGRIGRAPLMIDPTKRSVDVFPNNNPKPGFRRGDALFQPFVHEGFIYYRELYSSDHDRLLRTGCVAFEPELVNQGVPKGQSVFHGGRVYVWDGGKSELYVASGLRAPFHVVPGPPSTGREDAPFSGIGLSHHYGVVIWNAQCAYGVELRPRDGKQ